MPTDVKQAACLYAVSAYLEVGLADGCPPDERSAERLGGNLPLKQEGSPGSDNTGSA
jgi:hypothetical protein